MEVISIIFVLFVCFGIPILVTAYFAVHKRAYIKTAFIGALMFFISQPLLRLNILGVITRSIWFKNFISTTANMYIYSVLLGLTAGLFEETARFIAFKFLIRKNLNWETGIVYGIGHGGFEAIYLLGISTIVSLVNGSYIMVPASQFLVGGIERIFAIIIHLGLSVLVLYGVKNRKNIYLLYAVLFHAIVDSPCGIIPLLLGKSSWTSFVMELYIFICAFIAFVFIVKFRKKIRGEIVNEN